MAAAAYVVLALVWWLDRDNCIGAQRAEVFSAIWAAIEAVGHILGLIGGAIATSLEAVVAWLVSAVGWLASRIGQILVSTGAIFAKAWEGLKILWSDVLKPALVWVDGKLRALQEWLKTTFKPVFSFLARVRDELLKVYTKFVRPIVDTIEFIRQLNRVLLVFHIGLLQKLDAVLQQIEQRVEEPFLWINAKLTEIWNALDRVVNADGLFQRLTLIRSMSRYAPNWMNGFWNRQINRDALALGAVRFDVDPTTRAPAAVGAALAAYYGGFGGDYDGAIAASAALLVESAGGPAGGLAV